MKWITAVAVGFSVLLVQGASRASQEPKPHYEDPQPMPSDRADDSYDIYSFLLKSGPIEWRDEKRVQWLIEDRTTATPTAEDCRPDSHSYGMNPHIVITAPADRNAEWNDVLNDYDVHCHNVILLQGEKFHANIRVHMLDEAARKRYQAAQFGAARKDTDKANEFADAAGMHRFSEVYFSADHHLAMVEQGMWCGGLCGNWSWVVLEHKDGKWVILPWVHSFMMS